MHALIKNIRKLLCQEIVSEEKYINILKKLIKDLDLIILAKTESSQVLSEVLWCFANIAAEKSEYINTMRELKIQYKAINLIEIEMNGIQENVCKLKCF